MLGQGHTPLSTLRRALSFERVTTVGKATSIEPGKAKTQSFRGELGGKGMDLRPILTDGPSQQTLSGPLNGADNK